MASWKVSCLYWASLLAGILVRFIALAGLYRRLLLGFLDGLFAWLLGRFPGRFLDLAELG